mmetsp:Transcript_543/g.931  ORF Transcript_543/g.931 Transcript_543/m.931 type:complete len:345 (+) Transcript_543:229-1263(+)
MAVIYKNSSLIALRNRLNPHILHFYNASKEKELSNYNFSSRLIEMKFAENRLICMLHRRLHIYNLSEMKVLRTIIISTFGNQHRQVGNPSPHRQNPNGNGTPSKSPSQLQDATQTTLLGQHQFSNRYGTTAVSPKYIAYVDHAIGNIQILDIVSCKTLVTIHAHATRIVAMAFNETGDYIATASENGRYIHIFHTESGKIAHEFYRGSSSAFIYDIVFRYNYVIVSANSGTIHIFKFNLTEFESSSTTSEIVHRIKRAVSAERAIATVKVKDKKIRHHVHITPTTDAQMIKKLTPYRLFDILVISYIGQFYRFSFDVSKSTPTTKLIEMNTIDQLDTDYSDTHC